MKALPETVIQLFQWKKSSVTMHLVVGLILVLSAVSEGHYNYNRNESYSNSYGWIQSPNYPSHYPNSANCVYTINANEASNITLNFEFLDIESNSDCSFDSVQITCKSHRIGLPTKYCGPSTPLDRITLSPCKQVEILFHSDGSVTRAGFSIRYDVTEIVCPSRCNREWNGTCSCGENYTDTTVPTPSALCSSECVPRSYSYPSYCVCLVSRTSTTTSVSTCPPGCSLSYDFYGYRSCNCNTSTTPRCASGCYRTTDWRGTSYCSCPSTTARPLNCGYGCYQDSGYWGRPFCNCPLSTRPPLYCSSGCYSRLDSYGYQYCYCPATTLPPCYSPCYYTYDWDGHGTCYCQTTATTSPSAACGNIYYYGSSGTITSPNYPYSYPDNANCAYIINTYRTSLILLTFDVLDMEYNQYCTVDWVQITCISPMRGYSTKYCTLINQRRSIPLSSCSQVEVLFHSDGSITRSGFSMRYQVSETGEELNQPHQFLHETGLPLSLKLGIGLGAGIGGFVLILLLVIMISFIVFSQRRAARNERRHTEELSVIRNIIGRSDDNNAQDGNHGTTAAEGFTNPLVDLMDDLPRDPPPYRPVEEAVDNNTPEGTNDEVMLLLG